MFHHTLGPLLTPFFLAWNVLPVTATFLYQANFAWLFNQFKHQFLREVPGHNDFCNALISGCLPNGKGPWLRQLTLASQRLVQAVAWWSGGPALGLDCLLEHWHQHLLPVSPL